MIVIKGSTLFKEDKNIISVRNYCSDDLMDLYEILSGYSSPTGRIWSEDMVKKFLSDTLKEQPDGVFVAEISGKVVGFAVVLYRTWNNVTYLDYIQVKIEWVNKGVGSKLITECIIWAEKKNARIIYTETGKNNEKAISFYKKHGFQITGCIPEYYQRGLDAVILVKKITI